MTILDKAPIAVLAAIAACGILALAGAVYQFARGMMDNQAFALTVVIMGLLLVLCWVFGRATWR